LYHESKVLAEKKVHEYIEKGLDAYILRPAITYGIGDDGFPRTLVKLIKRRMLLLPTEDIEIHLLDVSTLADLIITIMRSVKLHQRVFIAADATPISLKALANKIYEHYHQKEYPSFLKLPNNVFKALLYCCLFFHSEKWVTRIRLISNNWYYDINPTVKELSFKPADTGESFVRNMCN
jgi:nucleoside-diphosphate-sugar epimerase